MTRIRLTGAQASALDCRGVVHGLDPSERLLASCWKGDFLEFEEADRDALFSALVDEANAEDDVAEDRNADPDARRHARGARAALSNLSDKVLVPPGK